MCTTFEERSTSVRGSSTATIRKPMARRSFTMSAYPHCGAYPDEKRKIPIDGDLPPSLLLAPRHLECGSQLVGSFVTKASSTPPKSVSKAPVVVGKASEVVGKGPEKVPPVT